MGLTDSGRWVWGMGGGYRRMGGGYGGWEVGMRNVAWNKTRVGLGCTTLVFSVSVSLPPLPKMLSFLILQRSSGGCGRLRTIERKEDLKCVLFLLCYVWGCMHATAFV